MLRLTRFRNLRASFSASSFLRIQRAFFSTQHQFNLPALIYTSGKYPGVLVSSGPLQPNINEFSAQDIDKLATKYYKDMLQNGKASPVLQYAEQVNFNQGKRAVDNIGTYPTLGGGIPETTHTTIIRKGDKLSRVAATNNPTSDRGRYFADASTPPTFDARGLIDDGQKRYIHYFDVLQDCEIRKEAISAVHRGDDAGVSFPSGFQIFIIQNGNKLSVAQAIEAKIIAPISCEEIKSTH